MLLSIGKYVHINTGTHGELDGSTTFWLSKKTLEKFKDDQKYYNTWLKESNKFVNEDLLTIGEKLGEINNKS